MLVFMTVLMIVLNFMLSAEQPGSVDTTGHLGGAITGMIWGLAFFPRNRHIGQGLKKYGKIMVAAYFILFFLFFYTLRNTTIQQ